MAKNGCYLVVEVLKFQNFLKRMNTVYSRLSMYILLHILRMHGPITYNKHRVPIEHVIETMHVLYVLYFEFYLPRREVVRNLIYCWGGDNTANSAPVCA